MTQLIFEQPINASSGLSGSLFQTSDGRSFIVAGAGITVTSGSGQIEITSMDAQLHPRAFLTGSSFVLSATMASDFYVLSGTLTTSSIANIVATDAMFNEQLTFWIEDVTHPFTVRNLGMTSTDIFTSSDTPVKVNVSFDGIDWNLHNVKRLGISSRVVLGQTFEEMGLVLDLNPSQIGLLDFNGTGPLIDYVTSSIVSPSFIMTGSEHQVYLNTGSWSVGPTFAPVFQFIDLIPEYIEYADNATNYFNRSDHVMFDTFNSTSSSWKAWTIVAVFRNVSTTSKYQGVFEFRQSATTRVPMIGLEIDNTGSLGTGYRLALANTNNTSSSYVYVDTTLDTDKHLLTISADGNGNIDVWNGMNHVLTTDDLRPRSIDELILGSSWEGHPTFGYNFRQFDGLIARFLVFNRSLTDAQRTFMIDVLNSTYEVF